LSVFALVARPLCTTFETLMSPKLALGFLLLIAKPPLILKATPPVWTLTLTPLGKFPPIRPWRCCCRLGGPPLPSEANLHGFLRNRCRRLFRCISVLTWQWRQTAQHFRRCSQLFNHGVQGVNFWSMECRLPRLCWESNIQNSLSHSQICWVVRRKWPHYFEPQGLDNLRWIQSEMPHDFHVIWPMSAVSNVLQVEM
jgi:hypothetical protein